MVNASEYLKERDGITIEDIDSHRDQRSYFDVLSMIDTLGSLKQHDDTTTKISVKSKRFVEG